MEFNLESVQRLIESTRALLIRRATEEKCVYPFRLIATNALSAVVWLAAIEVDSEERNVIVNLKGPEWGLMEFPVVLELEDAKGKKLIAHVEKPQRDYIH